MNEIYHAFKLSRKRTDWKDHKYYAKVRISPKVTRYFYSRSEYQAYLKNKQANISQKKDGQQTSSLPIPSKYSEKIPEALLKKTIRNDESTIAKGKAKTNESLEKIGSIKMSDLKDKLKDVLDSAKSFINKLFNKPETEAKTYKPETEAKTEKKDGSVPKRDSSRERFDKVFNTKMFEKETKEAQEAGIPLTEEKIIEVTENVQDEIEDISKMKVKEYDCTEDEDMALVNPFYSTKWTDKDKELGYDYIFSNNCASCSLAYELRRRGYDVEAGGMVQSSPNIYDLMELYSLKESDVGVTGGITLENAMDKANDIQKQILKKHGNGSRGQLAIYWRQGGAHSVVWECKNGEVIVRDCQTNKVMSLYEVASNASEIDYYRTDNISTDKIKIRRDSDGYQELYILNRKD